MLRLLLASSLLLSSAASAQVAPVPGGMDLEIGSLGGSSPSLFSGRYLSLDKSGSGSGRRFDWTLDGRASVADLDSRWIGSVPPPDPLYPDAVDPTRTSPETRWFLGVLGTVGRAYPLYGPLDFSWSLLGSARLDDMFPSLSLDQSAGLRARLGDGRSVGVFGGVTEGVAALSRDWATRSLTGSSSIADPHLATSPHVEVGAWGPLPTGGGSYQAFAGVQRNEYTELRRLEGSLARPGLGGTVSAGLRAEDERGVDVDFSRSERALRLGLDRGNGVEWGFETGRRDMDFGGARFEGGFAMITLTVREKDRSVTFRARGDSGQVSTPKGPWDGLQAHARDAVLSLDRLLSRIPPALEAVDPAAKAAELRAAYEALPPEIRAAVAARLGGAPDFDRLAAEFAAARPGAVAAVGSERARLRALETELSDPERLEKIVTRGLRAEMYRELTAQRIRLWGRDVPLTPGLLAAAVHAYGTGTGFVAPVPAGAMDLAAAEWLTKRLADAAGATCRGGDAVACALAELPPDLRARLAGMPAGQARELLRGSLRSVAESVRMEVNRELLSIYMSAKELDVLTVERGETPGVIDRRAMMGSYARLDERRAGPRPSAGPGPFDAAFALGARRLSAELEAERRAADEAARRDAAALRAELARAGVESTDEDLATLAAGYGVDSLRAFAASARGRVPAGRRVVLAYRPDPLLGLSITESAGGGPIILTLPLAPDRDPGRLLDALLAGLPAR